MKTDVANDSVSSASSTPAKYAILNPYGDVWSANVFDAEADARDFLRKSLRWLDDAKLNEYSIVVVDHELALQIHYMLVADIDDY